jgi:hypothetical protein
MEISGTWIQFSSGSRTESYRTGTLLKVFIKITVFVSVADPDPGSGAFLTPGSGIRNGFIPDPGSRIPDPKPIFLKLCDNFLGKKFFNYLKI